MALENQPLSATRTAERTNKEGLPIIQFEPWFKSMRSWVHSSLGKLDSKLRDLLIDFELRLWKGVLPKLLFLVHRGQPSDSQYTSETWRRLVSLYEAIRMQQNEEVRIVDVNNDGHLQDTFHVVLGAATKSLSVQ